MHSKEFWGIYVIIANVIPIYHSVGNVPRLHSNFCLVNDFFDSWPQCDAIFDKQERYTTALDDKCLNFSSVNAKSPAIFILYDVNAMEGFNLRRDVYIRVAVFLKKLRTLPHYENARLVLPPFYRLYHWNLISDQRHTSQGEEIIFWNHFFDITSLKRYTEVIDLWEYFDILKNCFGITGQMSLKAVFQLRHFDSMFESGKFEERFEVHKECSGDIYKSQGQFNHLYSNFTAERIQCVEFQGTAFLLHDLFEQQVKRSNAKMYSMALLNAETVLHDHWGNVEYWRARRSMRFNSYLIQIAADFRAIYFDSTDVKDRTEHPTDWRDEMEHRSAVGGNYLCAHLRRADFLRGREKTTPSLRSAATQIANHLKRLNLTNVFISSDGTGKEFHDLKAFLRHYRVFKFKPATSEDRDRLKPGGIAAVDQIICSHSRFFIGTYDSTFTYRIYEEREILNFPSTMTFNTFCKSPDAVQCERNSAWLIVYDEDRWKSR